MYKKPDRKYSLYLEDMLLSMKRIEEYIQDLDFEQFKRNYIKVDAVVRNFQVIGEAANNIPKNIQEKYPQIPWQKMYGLRNLIAHEYFGIDYEILWEIARNQLSKNLEDMEIIVQQEQGN
jgi:uncharacterized protein with HEPN domain